MQISNKCSYALRALFVLAWEHSRARPIKIANIASKQNIPKRFLEVILNELRQGGFVDSRRGVNGGYFLARKPETISIGEIVRFMDGDIAPVPCLSGDGKQAGCESYFQCPFYDFWLHIRQTIDSLYEGTSLADIVESWHRHNAEQNLNYEI